MRLIRAWLPLMGRPHIAPGNGLLAAILFILGFGACSMPPTAAETTSDTARCGAPCHRAYWLNGPTPSMVLTDVPDPRMTDASGDRSALAAAARWSEDLEVVRSLAERAGDLNTIPGISPLAAALQGLPRVREEKVALLRQLGADPDRQDAAGLTPLHRARDRAAVELLLEAGVDIEAMGVERMRPLHRAALEGRAEVAATLIENGAEIEAQMDRGLRPIHMAAAGGDAATVRTLINAGADPTANSALGDAHRISIAEGNAEASEIIVSAVVAGSVAEEPASAATAGASPGGAACPQSLDYLEPQLASLRTTPPIDTRGQQSQEDYILRGIVNQPVLQSINNVIGAQGSFQRALAAIDRTIAEYREVARAMRSAEYENLSSAQRNFMVLLSDDMVRAHNAMREAMLCYHRDGLI